MEVAGSAVGIASLGIQVCDGLLSYYDNWRSFESDIQDVYDCIKGLRDIFQGLDLALQDNRINDLDMKRVKASIASCEDELKRLQKKYSKFENHSKFKQAALRLYYPFKIGTLARIKDHLAEIVSRLQLAIQLLDIRENKRLHDVSHKMLSSLNGRLGSIEIQNQYINAQVQKINDQTNLVLSKAQDLEKESKIAIDGIQTLRNAEEAELSSKIMSWLSPPDYSIDLEAARKKREPGTGDWFLDLDKYRQWKSGNLRHLWLHGKAGCCKTVLSGAIIDDMLEERQFAYFFFTFSEPSKQTYRGLLCALIATLNQDRPISAELKQLYERHEPYPPKLSSLENALIAIVKRNGGVHIVLDALDECPDADSNTQRLDVLEGLHRIIDMLADCNFHLLITSRWESNIDQFMNAVGAVGLPINQKCVDKDIRLYVESQLNTKHYFRQLDEDVKQKVKQTLCEKADGMFRWAFCQLEALRRMKIKTPARVQTALENLPATLDETYERILISIPDDCRLEALSALRWLAFSEHYFTIEELAEAMIINPDSDETLAEHRRIPTEGILEILSPLVMLLDPDPIVQEPFGSECAFRLMRRTRFVTRGHHKDLPAKSNAVSANDIDGALGVSSKCRLRLAHISVKEYLICGRITISRARYFALDQAHSKCFLARALLEYTLYYLKHPTYFGSCLDLKSFPLLEYAATSWHQYRRISECTICGETPHLKSERLLICTPSYLTKWVTVYTDCHLHSIDRRASAPRSSPLYYACIYGLVALAKGLIEEGADVNERQKSSNKTLLMAAIAAEQKEVVALLLDAGVNASERSAGETFKTPLSLAIFIGNKEIVGQLVAASADVNVCTGTFGSALRMALRYDHIDIAEVLIRNGADVHANSDEHGSVLYTASYYGNKEFVDKLLGLGVDVNAKGGSCCTALIATCMGKHRIAPLQQFSTRQILLYYFYNKTSRDLSLMDCPYFPAEEQIISALVAHGADVNAEASEEGGTALMIASSRDQQASLELLLTNGAIPDAVNVNWGSALITAAYRNRTKSIETLLAHGAAVNLDAVLTKYNTLMSLSRRRTPAERLLEATASECIRAGIAPAGSDPTATLYVANALELAILNDCEEAVRLLLANGAKYRSRSAFELAKHHLAAEKKSSYLIDLVAEHGAINDN